MLLQQHVKPFLIGIVLLFTFQTQSQNIGKDLELLFNDTQLLGLAVSISINGSHETFNFGVRDVSRNLPITNTTHFRIASISKAFTALAVMKLYDAGIVDLDEDISNYLGYQVRNPNAVTTPITLRMVLSHRSGLQDGAGYANFQNATFSQTPLPNLNELLLPGGNFYTPNIWRLEAPGTYFTYSNLNFGLLGTIIEAVTSERFDVYMKSEILEPLGIDGSFNIQDLTDINELAALYRYQNGTWVPQLDNYEGVMPTPPDLSGYVPGTNGLYFAPQGGLRCTATDLITFLRFLQEEGNDGTLDITPATLQEMKAIAWDYNGSNGDNYFGLFNRWGLGLHHANTQSNDRICGVDFGTFIGHPGEAYGLISDAFFTSAGAIQFSILINGSRNGYEVGATTSFYTVEEKIFSTLCAYFQQELAVGAFETTPFTITPNPASSYVNISSKTDTDFTWQLFSVSGKSISESSVAADKNILDVSSLFSGIYFLKISTPNQTLVKKISIE